MNVLLVEDEQKIADFICEGLRVKNFNVIHCADGDQGYEIASQQRFGVIILDSCRAVMGWIFFVRFGTSGLKRLPFC